MPPTRRVKRMTQTPDNLRMRFEGRLKGLQRKMAAEGLGLVVYGPCPDLQYLTGLELDWRSARSEGDAGGSLFVPTRGMPVLTLVDRWSDCGPQTWVSDVRICEDQAEQLCLVRTVLRDLGVRGAKVASGDGVTPSVAAELKSEAGGAEPQSAAGLTDHLRMIKDAGEIELLREAARLTGLVLEAVVPSITEGVTQGDIEAEVALQGRRLGASGMSFPPVVRFIKSGSEPADDPFVYPEGEPLVPGTSIVFDFGLVKDGYCSDFGRSFYLGRAGREVRKAYEALHEGLLETVGMMHEGSMRVSDLFPALAAVVERLGYGQYLRARLPNGVLGHFIGTEVHEWPWISPACDQPLRANMVMALEPKVWRTGEYYLRVEDVVLVGADRTEFLTSFDRELFQL